MYWVHNFIDWITLGPQCEFGLPSGPIAHIWIATEPTVRVSLSLYLECSRTHNTSLACPSWPSSRIWNAPGFVGYPMIHYHQLA